MPRVIFYFPELLRNIQYKIIRYNKQCTLYNVNFDGSTMSTWKMYDSYESYIYIYDMVSKIILNEGCITIMHTIYIVYSCKVHKEEYCSEI